MAELHGKIQEFYALEQLALGNTVIHRLHPGAKFIAAFVYIVTVVSFDRFAFRQLIPFIFYPALLLSLSETPVKPALKRVLLALPFVLIAGLSNIIFDRAPVFSPGGITITRGLVSCASIILRTFLTVLALVQLMAVTPISELSGVFRSVHVPEKGIMLFEMTYRYIGVLLEETSSMYTAYHLRHKKAKGLDMRHMGSFIGSLMLKSFDRADRIYNAMKCRGYGHTGISAAAVKWRISDWVFVVIICSCCLLCRMADISTIIGRLFI